MIQRAAKFLAVGAFVFGVDFAAIWLLQQVITPLTAVSIAYVIAVSVHFCLNKWWIFAAESRFCPGELARYVVAVAACWACTVALVAAGLKHLTSNVLLAKAIAVPPTSVLGFALMRWFVFRPMVGRRPPGGDAASV